MSWRDLRDADISVAEGACYVITATSIFLILVLLT